MTKGKSLSNATRGAINALYKYNKMSFVDIGAVLNVPWETVRITYMRIAVRKTIFISKGDMISNHLVTRSVLGALISRIYSPLSMLVIRKENTHNKFNSKVTRHYPLWQKRPLHYSPFGPGATIPKEVPILGSETRVEYCCELHFFVRLGGNTSPWIPATVNFLRS